MTSPTPIPATEEDLCFLPAVQQRRLLLTRQVSSRDLLRAYLGRIERWNPVINAIVTMDIDGAWKAAQEADDRLVRGEAVGPLHGLVTAHKDLVLTRGMRTTFGSRLYRDFVPVEDDELVKRVRTAGAIRLGKTNVPEWGAGSHTFNPVFGATRNPYDTTRSAGGSSGGAAAALAAGLLSIADGSDTGGSLRNPASFNNVVGMRPSLGRVSSAPVTTGWMTLAVSGSMGRTVGDMALLYSAIAGFDPRDPNSLPGDGAAIAALAMSEPATNLRGVRVGWSRVLGDLPVEPVVTEVLDGRGLPVLAELGAEIRQLEPDFEGAEFSFRTLRAWGMVARHGEQYHKDPSLLSENLVANIEQGLDLTAQDIYDAHTARTRLYLRMVDLFDTIDILATPAVLIPPFPVEWTWPRAVADVPQEDYLGWMRGSWYVSATGLPSISVPCGFTPDGLPVGIQFVGRPQGEAELIRFAMIFERAHPVWQQRPVIAAPA